MAVVLVWFSPLFATVLCTESLLATTKPSYDNENHGLHIRITLVLPTMEIELGYGHLSFLLPALTDLSLAFHRPLSKVIFPDRPTNLTSVTYSSTA